MTKARDFNDVDWMAWAGCERWPGERPPLLRAANDEVLIIADKNSIVVYYDPTGGDAAYEFTMLTCDLYREMARLIVDALPAEGDVPGKLEELGFKLTNKESR